MANADNLTAWKPGQSGNLQGRPKGSKNLSTWIQNMLTDETIEVSLLDPSGATKLFRGTPIEAILKVLIIKAVNGDI